MGNISKEKMSQKKLYINYHRKFLKNFLIFPPKYCSNFYIQSFLSFLIFHFKINQKIFPLFCIIKIRIINKYLLEKYLFNLNPFFIPQYGNHTVNFFFYSEWISDKNRDSLDEIASYSVSKDLVNVLKNNLKLKNWSFDSKENFWINFIKELPNIKNITELDYCNTFKNLLYLEECYSNDSLEDISKKKQVKILKTGKNTQFRIKLNNIEEEFSFLKRQLIVEVKKVENNNLKKNCFTISLLLKIIDINTDDDFIIVETIDCER